MWFKKSIKPNASFSRTSGLYQFLRMAEEGLTSEVWFALKTDRGNTRHVAIKLFKKEFASFAHAEFDYCKSLLSDSIPKPIAVEEFSGQMGFAMEWVDGVLLLELIRSGQSFSRPMSNSVFHQLLKILYDFAKQNKCHGDINPRNIMVTRSGKIKLIDCGIASSPQEGTLIGTKDLLAPERWAGKPPSIESDLFSFGKLISTWDLPQSLKMTLTSNQPKERLKIFSISKPLEEIARGQFELIQAVEVLLTKVVEQKTQVLQLPTLKLKPKGPKNASHSLIPKRVGNKVASFILLAIFSCPSWSHELSGQAQATVSMRGNCWSKITINQIPYGFSPRDIKLKPGKYDFIVETASLKNRYTLQIGQSEQVLIESFVVRNRCLAILKMKP